MSFLKVFWIVTFFISVIINDISIVDILLFFVSTIASLYIFEKYKFYPNLGKYFFLFFVWCSIIMMPSYHLVEHILGYVNYNVTQKDYSRILSFGIRLYIIVAVIFAISSGFIKRKRIQITYNPVFVPQKIMPLCFAFLFALTFFCYVMNIGRMGTEERRLPFHLTGIINIFRNCMVPIVFAVLVENALLRGVKINIRYILIFFLWSIFETMVGLSKGVLVNHLLPLITVCVLYYRPSVKSVLKWGTPVIALFLFLYPIITTMRQYDGDSIVESFSSARSANKENPEESTYKKVLNRTFMTSYLYGQDYDYINHEELFDFTKVPLLYLNGGAAGYQTHVIDNYPDESHHSSGTSGIIDPLLHGGVGLCYLTVIAIFLFSCLYDVYYDRRQYGLCTEILLFLWGFCNVNFSSLYDSTGLQNYLVMIICVILTRRLNYRKNTINIIQEKLN